MQTATREVSSIVCAATIVLYHADVQAQDRFRRFDTTDALEGNGSVFNIVATFMGMSMDGVYAITQNLSESWTNYVRRTMPRPRSEVRVDAARSTSVGDVMLVTVVDADGIHDLWYVVDSVGFTAIAPLKF